MRKLAFTALCSALGSLAFAMPASAQGAGLDGLHEKRQEGGRICMADHFHDGSGTGRTRKAAEADTARAWAEFTGWEYGAAWASFSTAASKTMTCSDNGGSWSCQASARPCRPAAGKPRSRR